jgi:hypothetical protein
MPQLKMVSLDSLLHSHPIYRLGGAGKNYSDINLFARHGIGIQWQAYRHSVNSQHQRAFVSHLSALDPLLNGSEERLVMLACGAEEEEK